MEDSPLRYDVWIEDALRTVIRNALAHVAREGLPGEHHFYVTFRMEDPGVVVPPHLQAQHPDEMTIVIQHQFDNLHVDRDAFEITLYFKGKAERLRVPFRAVTAFSDPSVNFGLQLKMITSEETEPVEDDQPFEPEGISLDASNSDDKGDGEKTGEVIALDSFRKK
ncbi:MAG: ClpXP protease specificity-enhancing factor SspB [Rhodospirillaceae bacterium]